MGTRKWHHNVQGFLNKKKKKLSALGTQTANMEITLDCNHKIHLFFQIF